MFLLLSIIGFYSNLIFASEPKTENEKSGNTMYDQYMEAWLEPDATLNMNMPFTVSENKSFIKITENIKNKIDVQPTSTKDEIYALIKACTDRALENDIYHPGVIFLCHTFSFSKVIDKR